VSTELGSADIALNLKLVRERMAAAAHRAGRNAQHVKLVAVTKTHSVGMIEAAIAAGVTDIGENKVQEALEKKAELDAKGTSVTWHLIGHLQSNKAKLAVQHFELIHSVDSLALAQEIDRQATKLGKQQRILLQLNVSGEESKFGIDPTAAGEFADGVLQSCANLRVEGLMTMAPFSDNPEDARPHFRALKQLSYELRAKHCLGAELSMGMTGDFEVALQEGATLVRIGSAIFGHRE
jgi:pyridoxal phosphate enzyme (YggS family)